MPVKKYSNIQFIGMAVSTTPGGLHSIEETSDDGHYLGYENIAEDFHARFSLLRQAIANAYDFQDHSQGTLKVFVIPEFFFRGDKGAYFGNSQNVFDTYFQDLIKFLSQEKYQNWLFVLGTLLTSEAKIDYEKEPVKSLFPLGGYLLDIYNRLYPSRDLLGISENKNRIRDLLGILDEENTNDSRYALFQNRDCNNQNDQAFLSIMKTTLDYCDEKADIMVSNRCYIVEGGCYHPRVIQILKRHKSKEDFILNPVENQYIQSITRYPEIPEKSEWKESDQDDYSIFEYGGIRFGIEICLDHSRGRLIQDLKRFPEHLVDVQMVVSCGMDIRPHSVTAATNGLVFNCDGEYVLDDAENGDCCHTMLKVVEKCSTGDESAVLSDHIKLDQGKKKSFPCSKQIYPCDTYEIHAYPAFEIKTSAAN